MQENRFEKQVRETLDGLSFRPTAPVWENVAASIRRRRRRRAVVYLSLITLLGAGLWLATWTLRNNMQENAVAEHGSKAENMTELARHKRSGKLVELDNQESGIPVPASDQINIPATAGSPAPQEDIIIGFSASPNRPAIVEGTRGGNNSAARFASQDGGNDRAAFQNANLDNPVRGEANNDLMGDPGNRPKQGAAPITRQARELNTGKKSLRFDTDPEKPVDKPIRRLPSSKDRKIAWAIEFAGGLGKRKSEIFPGIGKASSSELYRGTGVALPPSSFVVTRVFPSASQAGPAFAIGVMGRYPISSRINLLGGLRYQYQSDEIRVGIKIDTAIRITNAAANTVVANAVYNGPASYNQTNSYHFLQAPIGVEWQLNRGDKTPIFWEATVAPGLLVASNALVYDTTLNGIYYKDRSMLHKLHLTAGTAFTIQPGNIGPVKWSIGPEMRVNLTPLGESKYDTRQYFIYGGLKAIIKL